MPGIDAFALFVIHADGVDGSNDFEDASYGRTVTSGGDPTIPEVDTAQKVFGTGSCLFDGTTPNTLFLSSGGTNIWVPSGDFTYDARIRFATTNAEGIFGADVDGNNWWGVWLETNTVYLRHEFGGFIIFTVSWSWTPSINTWYHIAVVRNGNNFILFVDGTIVSTQVDATGFTSMLPSFNNGRSRFGNGANVYTLDGWLDEMRYSNIARWIANFTPPTEAYAKDNKAGFFNVFR